MVQSIHFRRKIMTSHPVHNFFYLLHLSLENSNTTYRHFKIITFVLYLKYVDEKYILFKSRNFRIC